MDQAFGETTTIDEVLDGLDMHGRRVFITGISSGLGLETTRALVARGADVVGGVFNLAKAKAATEELARTAAGSISYCDLNLASLASVRQCADKLLQEGQPFDVLIANAGIMACPQGRTIDGFETQFGTNHLGHFLLINRLAPLLHPGGRVVCLSSNSHRTAEIDLADPHFDTTPYNEWLAYGRSKTANALFACEFDRRWQVHGIRAASVHPGGIHTDLDRHLPAGSMAQMAMAMDERRLSEGKEPLKWKSVPQGAATTAWAGFVGSAELVGGHYCEDCGVARLEDDPDSMSGVRSYIYDEELAANLWTVSERLVGESF